MKHGARLKYDFRKLPAEVRERAERLVTEHRGLARKAIRLAMRKFPRLDEHEVESHVMWSLMRCALNYDPATGWRFSTYAYRSLVLAAHQIARRSSSPGRGGSRRFRTTFNRSGFARRWRRRSMS
jgi:DNA-directed RNA polymerase specialized sigma subunit